MIIRRERMKEKVRMKWSGSRNASKVDRIYRWSEWLMKSKLKREDKNEDKIRKKNRKIKKQWYDRRKNTETLLRREKGAEGEDVI